MRVEEVPDPVVEEPTDAIVRVTTTGLCGSDLHLYEPLAPFMDVGDVVGHDLLPDAVARPLMTNVGFDRVAALHAAIDAVRRGGTVSVSGVYGGATEPMPMMQMFDKQIQLRMGQANVRRWSEALPPLLADDADPLGVESFATHRLPLDDAPAAYAGFQAKEDGMVKVLFTP